VVEDAHNLAAHGLAAEYVTQVLADGRPRTWFRQIPDASHKAADRLGEHIAWQDAGRGIGRVQARQVEPQL
jgi:hypothetical protein